MRVNHLLQVHIAIGAEFRREINLKQSPEQCFMAESL